jgi:hypothetical protein
MNVTDEDVYTKEQATVIDPSTLASTVVLLSDTQRYKIARYLLSHRKARIKTLMVCSGADFRTAREHVRLMIEALVVTRTFENLSVDYSLNRETLFEVLLSVQMHLSSMLKN